MYSKNYTITTGKSVYTLVLAESQRAVLIHKIYNSFDSDSNIEASLHLSDAGFKLYMYFIRIGNRCVWTLSVPRMSNETGLPKDTVIDCLEELESKGYLVKGDIQTVDDVIEDGWHFLENPRMFECSSTQEHPRRKY